MISVLTITKFNKGVMMEHNDLRHGMDLWLNLFHCANILQALLTDFRFGCLCHINVIGKWPQLSICILGITFMNNYATIFLQPIPTILLWAFHGKLPTFFFVLKSWFKKLLYDLTIKFKHSNFEMQCLAPDDRIELWLLIKECNLIHPYPSSLRTIQVWQTKEFTCIVLNLEQDYLRTITKNYWKENFHEFWEVCKNNIF